MGGGLTLKPGREHMLYSEQLPLTKNNQGISHREDDTPTFWPYSTTSTITFFFNQVFKWLPFHIERYVCNEGSVSFSWIGIWLKAIASSFYVFLLPLLILSRSFSFTEFKREKKHSQVSTTQKTIFDFPGQLSWQICLIIPGKVTCNTRILIESLKLKWSIELKTAVVHSWKSIYQKTISKTNVLS